MSNIIKSSSMLFEEMIYCKVVHVSVIKKKKGDLYLLDVADDLLISNFVPLAVNHVEHCMILG